MEMEIMLSIYLVLVALTFTIGLIPFIALQVEKEEIEEDF